MPSCWGNRCEPSPWRALRHTCAAQAALLEKADQVPPHGAAPGKQARVRWLWTLTLGQWLSLSEAQLSHPRDHENGGLQTAWRQTWHRRKHIYPVEVSLPPLCQPLLKPGARDTGDQGHKTNCLTVLTGQQTDRPTEGHSKNSEGIKGGGESTWRRRLGPDGWVRGLPPSLMERGGGCAGERWAQRRSVRLARAGRIGWGLIKKFRL